jgi:hypothetical protein
VHVIGFSSLVSPPTSMNSECSTPKFYGIKLDAWKIGPNAGPSMTRCHRPTIDGGRNRSMST